MNRKKKLGWWKHIDFMLIDLLCIQIAYLAAYFSVIRQCGFIAKQAYMRM